MLLMPPIILMSKQRFLTVVFSVILVMIHRERDGIESWMVMTQWLKTLSLSVGKLTACVQDPTAWQVELSLLAQAPLHLVVQEYANVSRLIGTLQWESNSIP